MEIRAIYIPDTRYDSMPVFRRINDQFVCIGNEEFRYDVDAVLSDSNWIVVTVETEEQEIIFTR